MNSELNGRKIHSIPTTTPPVIKRPPVERYDNPTMHFIGSSVRKFFNFLRRFETKKAFDPALFDVHTEKVALIGLDNTFDGYRILQLSDIHIGTWMDEERLKGVVELSNAQMPDLIVMTGDFITHHVEGLNEILQRQLSRLYAPDGVLAVLGNHDYWSNPDLVRDVLRRSGIEEIGNLVRLVQRDGAILQVAGLDNVYNQKDRLDAVLEQLEPDVPAILLVHEPDIADVTAHTGRFGLELSGHSHGGQIVLPGIGMPGLPPLGRKYPSGRYQINGMVHYTNRGVGTATTPIRWNCPPEITIFELEPVKQESLQIKVEQSEGAA